MNLKDMTCTSEYMYNRCDNLHSLVSPDSGVFVTSIASLGGGGGDSVSLTSLESDMSGRWDPTSGVANRHRQSSSASPRKNFSSTNLSVYNLDGNRWDHQRALNML